MKRTVIYLGVLFLLISCAGYKVLPNYKNNAGYSWKLFQAKQTIKDSVWVTFQAKANDEEFLGFSQSECDKFPLKKGVNSVKLPRVDVLQQFSLIGVGYYTG